MWAWPLALIAAFCASAAISDPAPAPQSISPVDLTKLFHTRSPWILTGAQGPQEQDYGMADGPGPLSLCLRKGPAGPCQSAQVSAPQIDEEPAGPDWTPRYLLAAAPAYPLGPKAPPLLEIVTASQHSGDGDQIVVTQFLKYDDARDAFERVYLHSAPHNHNEEVRFVAQGPLRGAVISADPTGNAPFGYWIAVSQLTPERTYRQTLRYRSATRYNDGNALAVIDSEMPNIEQRLGLWKPGSPLPLPAHKPCPSPHLKRGELWCG